MVVLLRCAALICGMLLALLATAAAQEDEEIVEGEEIVIAPDDDFIDDGYYAEDEYEDPFTSTTPAFPDIPSHHWAYEAIDYLRDAGLVEGYPDGTFRGDRSFTRYEMAMVIARIYTTLQDWQAMLDRGEPAPVSADVNMDEIYARFNRLADEFRDELRALDSRVTAIEDEQARMRSEMSSIRDLVRESGLSGTARWRTGSFIGTGSQDISSELGFEQEIRLRYHFQPEPGMDFNLSLTSYENEGPVSDAFKPGLNNETGSTNPSHLPQVLRQNSSSFVVDEANIEYCWDSGPGIFGDCPVLTIGRHYFQQGEFGLAGDNGYRSTFGVRLDATLGRQLDAYAGLYRPSSVEALAPFNDEATSIFDSSALTSAGDDMVLAGLAFHVGEGSIPGHQYRFMLRADVAPSGYGAEQYFGLSGNAEIPWFGRSWLSGLRGEWVMVQQNAAGQNPADLGLTNNSFIIEADIYKSMDSRFSAAFAQIAQIEALPVFGNVDNDPFSEWDFTINPTADAFNFSREGLNYFPSDFRGFGVQAAHRFGGNMHATLSFYDGDRVDAAAAERPGMLRLNLRFPFSNNSQFGLDFITAGERSGLSSAATLVRGEYMVNF